MNDQLLFPFPLEVYIAIGVFFGAIGAYLAEKKGRTHYKGFLVGFLFGLFGVLFLMVFLKEKKSDNQ